MVSPIQFSVIQIADTSIGGRQIDGVIPSLYALDRICQSYIVRTAQETNKMTVLFDSGIRTGSDIIKAMALGAQGVLCQWRFFSCFLFIAQRHDIVGRPWVYGLTIGGQEGVEQVVKHTLAELEITLGLCWYSSLGEIWGRRDEIITKVDL